MNILIFGKGWIGTRLAAAWPHAVAVDVRIEDRQAVLRAIDQYRPDVIINTAAEAGRPNIDWCESHPLETAVSNTTGPIVVASACEERKVYLLHLSTGDVFHGQSPDTNGWMESDSASPSSVYTQTKYAADIALARMPNVGIARLRLPIDWMSHPRNLIDKLASYKEIIDVENSVSVMDDVIAVLHQLLEKRGTGIFHVTNPGALKYRDLINLYREYVDPNHACTWITEDELVARGLAAKKRAICILQSTRLGEIGISMRPIDVALRETMLKYAVYKKNQDARKNDQTTPAANLFFKPTRVREMKGVITAGGMGTRLLPLTSITNKHLLAVYNKPIIMYPLQTLLDANVRNILLITGPEYAHQFVKLLGSGSKYGCKLSYRIQDEAGGIAQAVGMAEDFVGDNNCVVHLGDNIFEDNFHDQVGAFQSGAVVFYKYVKDPKQYGVIEIDDQGRVLSIEEKPKEPKSNFAQLGLYFYDPSVFEIVKGLKPSGRGELEISEVNATYMKQGHLVARAVEGRWFDTGTFQDIKRANEYFAEKDGVY